MKIKFLATIFAILMLGQISVAQEGAWELVYEETSEISVFKGIVFVPGTDNLWQTGWAAHYDGRIQKTTDGGDTWEELTQSFATTVWGIDFVDENIGFICDQDGQILKTVDGGTNWAVVYSNSAYSHTKIKFKDANNGITISYPLHLYTSDGGTTWSTATGTTSYWGADYADGDTYYAVEAFSGLVGRTEDNGATWNDIHETNFGITSSVNFFDGTYGIVGGSGYSVDITTDGGASWTDYTVASNDGDILAVDWYDKDTVWAAGSGVHKSIDGGITWSEDTSMVADDIYNREMFITDMNTVYVSGDDLLANLRQIWRKIGPRPLQADFEADETIVCTGSTVNFTDLSIGVIDSWSWTFEGGTPSSSTDQNPSVIYNSTGVFDVELTITDDAGNNTTIKTEYISVLETPAKAGVPDGEADVCTGETYYYAIDEVDFAQDYDWEVSPADAGVLVKDMNEATFSADNTWTGSFTIKVRATNLCGNGEWSDNMEGTLFASPESFELLGGGGYCLDGDGVEITLAGSQDGITYELYLDGVATGITSAGTGSEISFGLVTAEGYYEAIGSNDNCDLTMTGQIQVFIEYPPVEPEAATGPETICEEVTSDYTSAGSEDADSYVWEINPEEAGTITSTDLNATVTWNSEFAGIAMITLYGVNDCGEGDSSEALEVSVGAPNPEITGEEMVCDFSSEMYEVANNEGSTYAWIVTGGVIAEGQGTNIITIDWDGEGSGSVSVEEETVGGCSGSSEEFLVIIDDCTGVDENSLENSLSIFPNPANEFVNIVSESKIYTVSVYSMKGELVERNEVQNNDLTLKTANYKSGIYFIRINTESGIISKRLIVE